MEEEEETSSLALLLVESSLEPLDSCLLLRLVLMNRCSWCSPCYSVPCRIPIISINKKALVLSFTQYIVSVDNPSSQ